MKEQQSWKTIIDDFQDGLLILNSEHKAFYQNTALTNIFGSLGNESGEEQSESGDTGGGQEPQQQLKV